MLERGEPPAQIKLALRRDGVTETDRCIYGWIRKLGRAPAEKPAPTPAAEQTIAAVYAGASGAATIAAAEAVAERSPDGIPSVDDLAAAIDDAEDPIAHLRVFKRVVNEALVHWAPRVRHDRRAVNSAKDLIGLDVQIERALIDLTPRPEAEAQRLEAFGVAARDALIARAQAAAQSDEAAALRKQVAAQLAVIDALAGGE